MKTNKLRIVPVSGINRIDNIHSELKVKIAYVTKNIYDVRWTVMGRESENIYRLFMEPTFSMYNFNVRSLRMSSSSFNDAHVLMVH